MWHMYSLYLTFSFQHKSSDQWKSNLQSKNCRAIEGACQAAGIGRVVEGIGVLAMPQAVYC